MIRIERAPPPPFFSTKEYGELRGELQDHFRDFGHKKRQSRYEWHGVRVLNERVGKDLLETFRGKCAFCESLVGTGSPFEVEHFRPRRGARGFGEDASRSSTDSTFYDIHYWWLALEWDNLLAICQQCNRFKGAWFPIADESKRAAPETYGADLDAEEPLLLDPCRDDPERHLRFERDGAVRALSHRGQVTIDILNLNRSSLTDARRKAVDRLEERFEDLGSALDARFERGASEEVGRKIDATLGSRISYLKGIFELKLSLPHLAIQRQFLSKFLERGDAAAEVLAETLGRRGAVAELQTGGAVVRGYSLSVDAGEDVDDDAGKADAPAPPAAEPRRQLHRLALEKIELHNFKNIADLTLEVPQTSRQGRAPWLLFLGENGVGKSSILQAIVLTLLGEKCSEATGVVPEDVLRFYKEDGEFRRCEEGRVRIWISETEEPLDLVFRDGDPDFHGTVGEPGTYLLAYGPTRLLPQEDLPTEDSPGRVRVKNLFKPSSPLIDVSRWLFDLSQADAVTYDIMVRGIRRMLLMKDHESIEPDLANPGKKRILIELKNETTTLDNLSDGYRTILALTADLMYMLRREGTSMEEAEGIVVIDEIGSNLHPGWKKRIVGCLREVFPKIQFIVTTHEPLCLRGVYESETTLLRRDYDERIVAVTDLPNPNDLRVDELLASEFFGLSSTLESDVEEIYSEYYRLLTVPRPTREQKARIAELKEELRDREHLGHGLRDELMYEVIDKLLAEQLRSPKPKSRPQLKKEALEKVLESWKESGLYDDYLQESGA